MTSFQMPTRSQFYNKKYNIVPISPNVPILPKMPNNLPLYNHFANNRSTGDNICLVSFLVHVKNPIKIAG